MPDYDPAADLVHGSGWNSAARWGGWDWRQPRRGEHYRTCSFCGCIHPEDLAAESSGGGACLVCGQKGWEAHFRALQPLWYKQLKAEGNLGLAELTAEETAQLEAAHPDHTYNPGGWWASWADWKYGWPHKFYVHELKPRDPSLLRYMGSASNTDEQPEWGGHDSIWVRADQLTAEQKEILTADGAILPEEKDQRYGGSTDPSRSWYCLGHKDTLFAKFYTKHLADPAISQEAKDTIQQIGGLQFTFTDDGYVSCQEWNSE